MKLINKTRYLTRDLRKFFRAGLLSMGAELDKKIEVVDARSAGHGGKASIGCGERQGSWIRIQLPDPEHLNLRYAALVFEHEVAHNLGLQHGDMNSATRMCAGELPEWATGLAIGIKPAKPTPPPQEKMLARRQHAERMAEKWARKLARAKKAHAKWASKVRYYEKKAQLAAGQSR